MRRLLLVRHAATPATRSTSFPLDESLDVRGRVDARALAARLPAHPGELLSSPALRCVQTAAAAGLGEPCVQPALAECDFGSWAGHSLAAIHSRDARAAAAWMTDPAARPHGGESLAAFAARIASWLDGQAWVDGAAVAITHGGVVKAAVVHALGAPFEGFWRIDAAPLSITELHAHDGRWTVTRMNCRGAAVVSNGPRYPCTLRHDRPGRPVAEAGAAGAGAEAGAAHGAGGARA